MLDDHQNNGQTATDLFKKEKALSSQKNSIKLAATESGLAPPANIYMRSRPSEDHLVYNRSDAKSGHPAGGAAANRTFTSSQIELDRDATIQSRNHQYADSQPLD